MQTKRLPSSPPRLLCLSPGQGPSVSSLSCPKPPLFWVMKPTLAHTTALTASHTPVSPTDTAGTHSHFTHAQAQPHQSTSLLRMGKGYHLVTLVASGSPLHSAPLSCLGLSHNSTPTASFDARLVDLLRPRPMHSCSLVQASTQMPTSLDVAAYERRCVRSTLERERRAASHQCAAREPPGPESRRGTMEHAQESTLADRRPQSGRQERAGDGRSKRPPSRAEGKNLCRWRHNPQPLFSLLLLG